MAYQFTVQTFFGLSILHDTSETLIKHAPKAPPLFAMKWIDPQANNDAVDMHRPHKRREDLVLSVTLNEPLKVQPVPILDQEGVGCKMPAIKDSFEIALTLMRFDPASHRMRWYVEDACEVTRIMAEAGFDNACKAIKREHKAIALAAQKKPSLS